MYICYLIANRNRTYIGSTNNFQRRLRQHNGELAGGARYTTSLGAGWAPRAFATGFRTHSEALSFEWHWKHGRDRLRTLSELITQPRFAHVDGIIVE